jgi:hypothetical protein
LAVGLATATALVVPTVQFLQSAADAAPGPTPPFTQCPAVGNDTSCGVLITVNANGSATVTHDPSQPAIDSGQDTLVGVVNDSNALVSSLTLSGSNAFGFDGHGLCAASYDVCTSPTEYGPTGYEGPGTSFTYPDASKGSVNLTGSLAPGSSRYFTLAAPTFSVVGVAQSLDIALTTSIFSAAAGVAATGQVATFTDGPSTAPAADFTATVNWGDGSPSTTGTITGGSGSPYVVSGTHTYADVGFDVTSVTVTDTSLALNTATASGFAVVSDAPITASPVTLPGFGVNQSSGPLEVATFTDGNPTAPLSDFSALIDWGDGSSSAGTITQPGGTGTTFDVSGSHTYTASGTYTVTVDISDVGGSTGTASDSADVANGTITCTGSGCSGTVSTPTESVGITSTSTTGTIDVTVDNTPFSCGDSFRHAPQYTTITDSGLDSARILLKVKFVNKSAAGLWYTPFAVCFQSLVPFTDSTGQTVTTGLLPTCLFVKKADGPCVKSIKDQPYLRGNVVENLIIPSNDPKAH